MKAYFIISILSTAVCRSYAQDVYSDTSITIAQSCEAMDKTRHESLPSKTDDKNGNLNKTINHNKIVKALTDENTNFRFVSQDLKNNTSFKQKKITHFVNKTKEHIIFALATKIESLAKAYLDDSQTFKERIIILHKVEKRIWEVIQNHRAMYSVTSEVNEYTDLIMQGLELAMKKLLTSNVRDHSVPTFGNTTTLKENNSFAGNNGLVGNNEFSGSKKLAFDHNVTSLFGNDFSKNLSSLLASYNITHVINKIKNLEKAYSNNSHTFNHKQNLIRKIERILRKLVQILVMSNKAQEVYEYVNFITQDLGMPMKKLIILKLRNMDFTRPDNSSSFFSRAKNVTIGGNNSFANGITDTSNSIILSSNSTVTGKNSSLVHDIAALSTNRTHDNNSSNTGTTLIRGNNIIGNYNLVENDVNLTIINPDITNNTNLNHIIEQYEVYFNKMFNQTSIDPRCDEMLEGVCLRLQSLQSPSCGDGTTIALEKICNGISDCVNGWDENNCTNEVADKIKEIIGIMSDIDQLIINNCLPLKLNGLYILKAQETLLISLKKEWRRYRKFLKRQRSHDHLKRRLFSDRPRTGEAAMTTLISTLSYALEGDLCIPHVEVDTLNDVDHEFLNIPSEMTFVDDNDVQFTRISEKAGWSPKSCQCEDYSCKSEDCDTRCVHICWQRYSLNHWECQSYTGEFSISLDFICDGKFDCFDKSDETACTTDSFNTYDEAKMLYQKVLETLVFKSFLIENKNVREKLLTATNVVLKLMERTTKFNVDIYTVKTLRDKYFDILVNVYDDVLQTSDMEIIGEAYDLLLELNERIVDAMKRSHTGNTNIWTSSNNCYCWDGVSRRIRSSIICNTTCEFEAKLMKYSCNSNGMFVAITDVCDGKNDCPNEEDETNCIKDVCGTRHLIELRYNIQDARLLLNGTTEQVLNVWKANTITALIAAVNNNDKHFHFKYIVDRILSDMVTSYELMQATNSTNSDVVPMAFMKMADIVKQALKICVQ